ncbi:50S ribosomal protein L7ae [Sporanaerobium hydrogeniformans]|uniref:50S ribosomal protein L7ae n=2 Tax=Sporanaerobium hydrogeniformans TaxID=3072179 RepID=A0AC61DF90_9FIRM|nr:50S ribosomal protein L7ae [Sporanaerobium hydrogeniformans]
MIALCQKARKLTAGEFTVKQAIKEQAAYLVIVASDASANTKKCFSDKCAYRKVPYVEWGTKEELGKVLGKEIRATVALLDENFANRISEMISGIH